jgi:hypothetical protein
MDEISEGGREGGREGGETLTTGISSTRSLSNTSLKRHLALSSFFGSNSWGDQNQRTSIIASPPCEEEEEEEGEAGREDEEEVESLSSSSSSSEDSASEEGCVC